MFVVKYFAYSASVILTNLNFRLLCSQGTQSSLYARHLLFHLTVWSPLSCSLMIIWYYYSEQTHFSNALHGMWLDCSRWRGIVTLQDLMFSQRCLWSVVFWDITLCSPMKVNCFGGACRPHLQDWISQARKHLEAGSRLTYTILHGVITPHSCIDWVIHPYAERGALCSKFCNV